MIDKSKNSETSHEEREKLNDLFRKYRKLKRRYENRPYPERNSFFYTAALITGWFSNIISAATASARVYVFIIGIFGSLLLGSELSALITTLVLVGIELSHRGFARSYFKSWWKNSGHTPQQNGNLIAMICLGALSCFLSFTGGFDFLRVALDAPEKQVAKEISFDEVNKSIAPLVKDAQKQADQYRSTRLWKGRLSTKDSKEWKKLLQKKEARQDSLLSAITRLPEINQQAKETVEKEYQQDKAEYELNIRDKGYGLGFITIISVLLMYLCIWFEEKYLKKTAEYLEVELAVYHNNASSPTPPSSSQQQIFQKLTELNTKINALQPIPIQNPIELEIENANPAARHPIGFKRRSVGTPIKYPLQDVATDSNKENVIHDDVYTILHHRFTDGKPVRLTQDRVSWYVKHYKNQLAKAVRLQERDSIENFKKKLAYWQQRQQELADKIVIAS